MSIVRMLSKIYTVETEAFFCQISGNMHVHFSYVFSWFFTTAFKKRRKLISTCALFQTLFHLLANWISQQKRWWACDYLTPLKPSYHKGVQLTSDGETCEYFLKNHKLHMKPFSQILFNYDYCLFCVTRDITSMYKEPPPGLHIAADENDITKVCLSPPA